MAAPQKVGSLSLKSWENRDSEVEGRDTVTMFDVFHGTMREKIVLQRLIVIARIPHDLADRTELGGILPQKLHRKLTIKPLERLELNAHYEKLNFQLSKQYIWDHMTGLLVIYPSCLLHIIESSREILLSVLKDLQQQSDWFQLESNHITDLPKFMGAKSETWNVSLLGAAKVVFMAHDPRSRMFHQWSYKVLGADQVSGDHEAKGHEEEEESTETLVCSVLSALQSLGEHPEISKKTLPGLVLDETPELIMPQEVLDKLLARDELQSPQQFLQMYDSPLNVSMDFGQVIRSRCLTTV